MQQIGYVEVRGERILVLVRVGRKYNLSVRLKMRKSGKDGVFMPGESEFLTTRPDLVEDLKNGKVVEC